MRNVSLTPLSLLQNYKKSTPELDMRNYELLVIIFPRREYPFDGRVSAEKMDAPRRCWIIRDLP